MADIVQTFKLMGSWYFLTVQSGKWLSLSGYIISNQNRAYKCDPTEHVLFM